MIASDFATESSSPSNETLTPVPIPTDTPTEESSEEPIEEPLVGGWYECEGHSDCVYTIRIVENPDNVSVGVVPQYDGAVQEIEEGESYSVMLRPNRSMDVGILLKHNSSEDNVWKAFRTDTVSMQDAQNVTSGYSREDSAP